MTRATTTMTMRMPVQTPALNIPSMTEQPVSRKKELDIKKYVNFFFIVCFVCGYKIETIENGYSFEEIGGIRISVKDRPQLEPLSNPDILKKEKLIARLAFLL